jgi:AraC-like DNA-binding protein
VSANSEGSSSFAVGTDSRGRLTSAEDSFAFCAPTFYPNTVEQLTAGQGYATKYRIEQIGPLTFGDISYSADVRVDFAELRSAYHVNLPISGSIQTRHRNVDVAMNPEVAAVFRPQGETVVTRWAAHSRALAVKMDRGFVERTLAAALRGTGSSALGFAPSIDLRTGPGRSWASLLRLFMGQLSDPDSVLREPMTAMPFAETIVNGFLTVASPAYRQALDQAAGHMAAAGIRAAVDIIHAEVHTPLTTAALARRSRVSARTLQERFQQHMGVPPMEYLRSVRLARAHAELRAADPSLETVSAVAGRQPLLNRDAAAAYECTAEENEVVVASRSEVAQRGRAARSRRALPRLSVRAWRSWPVASAPTNSSCTPRSSTRRFGPAPTS